MLCLFVFEKKTLEWEILRKGSYELLCFDILITHFDGTIPKHNDVFINYFFSSP